MTAPLDHFETALLTALRERVAESPPAQHTAAPSVRRRTPRLALTGVGVGLAAAAAVVFLPGVGTAPAYSVAEGNSGTIEVQVNRLEDAAGLEAQLAEYGIGAEITYLPDGGACAPGRFRPIKRASGGISLSLGAELFRVTIEPGTVRDGETLVIDASLVRLPDSVEPVSGLTNSGGIQVIVSADVTRGPVPACNRVPAPS